MPFCKGKLMTGNEIKPLSVVKKVCQAFGLFVNKAVKFNEAFKYAIMLVPLTVGTLKSTLYQPGKAVLRNYIIHNIQEMSGWW